MVFSCPFSAGYTTTYMPTGAAMYGRNAVFLVSKLTRRK
jgi:hypothetical protein